MSKRTKDTIADQFRFGMSMSMLAKLWKVKRVTVEQILRAYVR